jgi:lipid II:glycine glycyltransferase (peptidoglycan interpeptide bridge formation enzyme)
MGIFCECVPTETTSIRSASNLMQSPAWAFYKTEAAGWKPQFFRYSSDVAAGVLLSLEKGLTFGGAAVYVPWAPYGHTTAGYALQWKAVNIAKRYGCRIVHRRGCRDYPVRHEMYNSMVSRENDELCPARGGRQW